MEVITKLPLSKLFSEDPSIEFERKDQLFENDLKLMLKSGKVQFVTANVGNPIIWQEIENCYEFWKSEVRSHIVLNPERIDLSEYPGEYAYIASRWEGSNGKSIVLLEMCH